jgi:hypothetical protein
MASPIERIVIVMAFMNVGIERLGAVVLVSPSVRRDMKL